MHIGRSPRHARNAPAPAVRLRPGLLTPSRFWWGPVLLAGGIYALVILGIVPQSLYPVTAVIIFADRVAHALLLEARIKDSRRDEPAGQPADASPAVLRDIQMLNLRCRMIMSTLDSMCQAAGIMPPPEPPAGSRRLFAVPRQESEQVS